MLATHQERQEVPKDAARDEAGDPLLVGQVRADRFAAVLSVEIPASHEARTAAFRRERHLLKRSRSGAVGCPGLRFGCFPRELFRNRRSTQAAGWGPASNARRGECLLPDVPKKRSPEP
eukprot:scaffold1954_cov268-Pinguiococcus_pyrenoidosus.AAC.268